MLGTLVVEVVKYGQPRLSDFFHKLFDRQDVELCIILDTLIVEVVEYGQPRTADMWSYD